MPNMDFGFPFGFPLLLQEGRVGVQAFPTAEPQANVRSRRPVSSPPAEAPEASTSSKTPKEQTQSGGRGREGRGTCLELLGRYFALGFLCINSWLFLGNILHFCLLWFSGKSPLGC